MNEYQTSIWLLGNTGLCLKSLENAGLISFLFDTSRECTLTTTTIIMCITISSYLIYLINCSDLWSTNSIWNKLIVIIE